MLHHHFCKKRPNVLTHGWEVEICYLMPKIEGTDEADIDAAKYKAWEFPNKGLAIAHAKRVAPKDQWTREARVTEFQRTPMEDCPILLDHDYIGETEYIS